MPVKKVTPDFLEKQRKHVISLINKGHIEEAIKALAGLDNKVLREAQNKVILQYLNKRKYLSSIDALRKFGCFRLSARIWDLRHKQRKRIDSNWFISTESGKRFVKYSLSKKRRKCKTKKSGQK